MSGSRSRRKGAAFEREIAGRFAEAMHGAEVKRGLQYRTGEEVPDVDAPGLWIETKRGKKPNLRGALRQAARDASKGRIPIAVVRDDRAAKAKDRDEQVGTVVLVELDDFLEMLEGWWRHEQR